MEEDVKGKEKLNLYSGYGKREEESCSIFYSAFS